MRLHNISLTNFIAHEQFDHEFRAPITIFSGKNGAGKSSVGDGIAVALSGFTRGIQKKDRSALARGPESFEVRASVEVDGKPMPFVSTITKDSPDPGDRAAWVGSKELIRVLVDYNAWVTLSPDKRQTLLNSILPEHSWLGDPLPADLEEIRRARGIASALRTATEQRRGAKRTMEDFAAQPAPTTMAKVGETEIDLTEYLTHNFPETFRDLDGRIKSANRRLMRSTVLTQEARKTEEELQAVVDKTDERKEAQEKARDTRKKLNKAATQASEVRADAQHKYDEALQDLRVAESRVIESGECSVCGQEVSEELVTDLQAKVGYAAVDERNAKEELDNAVSAYDEAEAQAARARKDEHDAGVLLKECRDARDRLASVQEKKRLAEEEGLVYEDEEQEVLSLTNRRDRMNAIKDAVQRYEWDKESYKKDQRHLKRMKRTLDELEGFENTIKGNMKSGSRDVLAICGRHIESLGKHFGVELALDDTYLPRMGGIPFPLQCKSDQYLSLLAVQFALAVASGVKLVFIDDLDRLTPERNVILRRWLSSDVIGADVQVVAAVARDNPEAFERHPFHVVPVGAEAVA